MLKSSPWSHSKSKYALKEEERVLQKRAKTYKGKAIFKECTYTYIIFKAVFSHLYCLFSFFTSLMGK